MVKMETGTSVITTPCSYFHAVHFILFRKEREREKKKETTTCFSFDSVLVLFFFVIFGLVCFSLYGVVFHCLRGRQGAPAFTWRVDVAIIRFFLSLPNFRCCFCSSKVLRERKEGEARKKGKRKKGRAGKRQVGLFLPFLHRRQSQGKIPKN
ncbi:unnamed protein product [Trypanosoma congolense IL3000]|uniref:WGS project CAEQ00000000 data, annotated contig 1928 n=1 Tax=Trypanosoma congolense (strain IL3000) TaxID=1068625 RepID=F9WA40_TRYCI|nr:unnamed protein product [Trypanosoma congolense IL3000]